MFTGVVGAAVIAAVLASIWRVPRRRELTWLSVWLVIGVIANAVLGGISVLVDLHPVAVQGHLLLSMMLIYAATVLVRRASEPDGVPLERAVSRPTQRLAWIVFAVTSLAIVTGTIVTGAGPHAGDENAERLDIAIPDAARIHAVSVLTAIALALLLAFRLRKIPADRDALQTSLSRWIGIALFQGALGYVQYFNDVPELLVGIHVLGATLVMIATTLLVLDTRRPMADTDGTVPADGAPAQDSSGLIGAATRSPRSVSHATPRPTRSVSPATGSPSSNTPTSAGATTRCRRSMLPQPPPSPRSRRGSNRRRHSMTGDPMCRGPPSGPRTAGCDVITPRSPSRRSPAEAFEALLIAGAVLGQVGDDDPPYRLDVLLDDPPGLLVPARTGARRRWLDREPDGVLRPSRPRRR